MKVKACQEEFFDSAVSTKFPGHFCHPDSRQAGIQAKANQIEADGKKKVIVNFERPTDDGFDSARCELPDYNWTEKCGYTDDKIAMFERLLHSNAHLLFKYAANGGQDTDA
jgi:hypothetical protein